MAAANVETVAELVQFQSLCSLLEALSRLRKKESKKAKLADFIRRWKEEHRKLREKRHDADTTEDSFYAAMRLILPSFDKDRGSYGFKEHMLAKKLISVHNIPPSGTDARILLNYKAPHSTDPNVGDFASKAAEVMRTRLPAEGKLTLADVNEQLDAIVFASADKDKQQSERALEHLCRNVNVLQLKWLIRILLKQMKIGMSEVSVFATFHPDAAKLYDVSTSLKQVAKKLHDTSVTLNEIEICLWQPFRPMLAARVPPEKVPDIMHRQPFYVEIKYDGERVQLHKEGDRYQYFSRNGNDFTSAYGATSTTTTGSITHEIHDLFDESVKSCILDAEMVGWNPQASCIATKGEAFDVKTLRRGDDLHPCLVIFDVLMLNGKVLSARPLDERLRILQSQILKNNQQKPGWLLLAEHTICSTHQELIDRLNLAIEAREEGIVVKRRNSVYQLNTRSEAAGWLKVKPDYIDALNDDFDLCIVGGYFGEGHRAKLMSHFLLALAEPSESGGHPTRWRTVCKVGSGCKAKELYDLNVHLNQSNSLVVARKNQIPDWLIATGSEHPDVYIKPEHSRILQIRAAEITASGSYASGFTLRFPRVQKIRTDKDWHEAMTTAEYEKMRLECDGKIAHRHQLADVSVDQDETASTLGEPATKKRKMNRRRVQVTLPVHLQPCSTTAVTVKSDVFSGKEICVLCRNVNLNRQLTTAVKSLGGKCVKNTGHETWCVVTDSETDRQVQNVIASKRFEVPVAKHTWLLKCADETKHLEWSPTDLYHQPEAMRLKFSADFDAFGDSYTQPVTANELKMIMRNVNSQTMTAAGVSNVLDEEDWASLDYEYALLKGVRLYIDRFIVVRGKETDTDVPWWDAGLKLASTMGREYGAAISDVLDEACSHVVVSKRDVTRISSINKHNRPRARKFHIVTDEWVLDSVKNHRRADEKLYHPFCE